MWRRRGEGGGGGGERERRRKGVVCLGGSVQRDGVVVLDKKERKRSQGPLFKRKEGRKKDFLEREKSNQRKKEKEKKNKKKKKKKKRKKKEKKRKKKKKQKQKRKRRRVKCPKKQTTKKLEFKNIRCFLTPFLTYPGYSIKQQ